jgi:hypothetical protein
MIRMIRVWIGREELEGINLEFWGDCFFLWSYWTLIIFVINLRSVTE